MPMSGCDRETSRSRGARFRVGSGLVEVVTLRARGSRPEVGQVHRVGVKTEPAGYDLGVLKTRLDLDRIRAARRVIDPLYLNTPMYRCDALGRRLGCTVSIKLETANPVRSFKARGTELVAGLLTEQGRTAVVCASAGNLG